MKHFYFLVIFVFTSFILSGQTFEFELNKIEKFRFTNPDSAIYYSKIVQNKSINKFPKFHALGLIYEARSMEIIGQMDEASRKLDEALKITKKYNLLSEQAKCYSLISIIHEKIGNIKIGNSYLKKAYQIYLDQKDSVGTFKCCTNLTYNYIRLKDKLNARFYLNLLEKNTFHSSEKDFYVENMWTNYFLLTKEFKKSEKHAEKALGLARKNKMIDAEVSTLMNLGIIFLEQGSFVKSNSNLILALNLSKQINAIPDQKDVLQNLIKLKKQENDYQEAFRYSVELSDVKDTLLKLENLNFIHGLERKLQLSEKEEVIEKQKNKILIRELESKKLNEKIFFYSVLVVLLSVLVTSFIFLYMKIRSKNKLILSQKIEVETKRDELEKANNLNQKIFAILSHDIQGPINALEIFVDLVQTNKNDYEFALELLPGLKNQINQTNLVLFNLLSYAKSELNFQIDNKEKIPSKSIVDELLQEFQREIESKNVALIFDVEKSEPYIFANKNMLKIILRNILSNAIKYSHENGRIFIVIKENEVFLEDFGLGIPYELKSKIFQEVVKSDIGTQNEKGYGIGLKLTSDLVQRIGGEILIIEKSTVGTLINVRFK